MKQIRNTSLFFLLVIGLISNGIAGNGGSAYSRFGLGDINYFSSSRAMGMGGAGIAILSQNEIDLANPATWGRINHTRFLVSVLYEGFSTTDGTRSAFLSGANFNGFTLAIPIAPASGIVFGTGITPFSRINYNVHSSVSQGNLDYQLKYVGDGGLSQAHAGISANMGSELHVGAKFNYYFGALRQTTTQSFASSDYTDAERERSMRLNGIGFTFGAVYSGLTKIFNFPEKSELNIGTIFTTTSYLTSMEEQYFSYTTGTLVTRDTNSASRGKVRMPYAFGVGVSYLGERILVASDFSYQNWNRYKAGGFNSAELRDSYCFGVGGELLPQKKITAPFFQRLTYRLGFFHHSTYYRIAGEPINETGFTGGIDIPIFGETRLTIGTEYSFRGTIENRLQKDKILRISFTLSGGEFWFLRPEQE